MKCETHIYMGVTFNNTADVEKMRELRSNIEDLTNELGNGYNSNLFTKRYAIAQRYIRMAILEKICYQKSHSQCCDMKLFVLGNRLRKKTKDELEVIEYIANDTDIMNKLSEIEREIMTVSNMCGVRLLSFYSELIDSLNADFAKPTLQN